MIDRRYVHFFELFKEREYFECHEVLEEIWIEETNCSTKVHPAIVLLQFSVALLHWERGNFVGALAVFRSSLNYLESLEKELISLTVDSSKLKEIIKKTIEKVENKKPYVEINIPRCE